MLMIIKYYMKGLTTFWCFYMYYVNMYIYIYIYIYFTKVECYVKSVNKYLSVSFNQVSEGFDLVNSQTIYKNKLLASLSYLNGMPTHLNLSYDVDLAKHIHRTFIKCLNIHVIFVFRLENSTQQLLILHYNALDEGVKKYFASLHIWKEIIQNCLKINATH